MSLNSAEQGAVCPCTFPGTAPLACPDTGSVPLPGGEPSTCSQHAGQEMGLKCDISSFINVLSFGRLEHMLLLSCLSSPCLQALLPASPPFVRSTDPFPHITYR